jgi:hypothetical protein
MAGFGISCAEPLGSAARELVRRILRKEVVTTELV